MLSMRTILITIILTTFIFPQQSKLSKAVNYLSGFIASEYFNELNSGNSDLALVDTIYLRAVNYFEGDYSEALLALTFTTVPYNEVPMETPILKNIFYYPLISASDLMPSRRHSSERSSATLLNTSMPRW